MPNFINDLFVKKISFTIDKIHCPVLQLTIIKVNRREKIIVKSNLSAATFYYFYFIMSDNNVRVISAACK